MFPETQDFVFVIEDCSFSVCSWFTCGFFSFPSRKRHHSKTSDGHVQKLNTADCEDEPLRDNVVQKKLHCNY